MLNFHQNKLALHHCLEMLEMDEYMKILKLSSVETLLHSRLLKGNNESALLIQVASVKTADCQWRLISASIPLEFDFV